MSISKLMIVDTHYDVEDVWLLDGCAHDHTLHPIIQVSLKDLGGEKVPSTLEHQLDSHFSPRNTLDRRRI